MAANFIGWNFAMLRAEPSPVSIVRNDAAKPNIAATLMLLLANSCSLFFSKNQALTPITKIEAKI